MNVFALDLGTRTGWALWDGFRLESGVQVFDVKRGESPGTRYLRFNRWLDGMVFAQATNGQGIEESVGPPRVAVIVYEQPFVMRSGAAAEITLGFATRVQEFCARHHLDHLAVNGMTLKKWTTGKGNADKKAMLDAVTRRWRRVEDHNEADAVALLYYAQAEVVPAR